MRSSRRQARRGKVTVVVNLKNYPCDARKVATSIEKNRNSNVHFILAPQTVELSIAREFKGVEIFAQHCDAVDSEKSTGFIAPFLLKKIGVKGTILNHSEHRLKVRELEEAFNLAKKHGLKVIVCVEKVSEIKKLAEKHSIVPEFFAIEPKELIGSGVAISREKPEIVKKAAEVVKELGVRSKLLCGAGISSVEDIKASLELGSSGVLIASWVAKARKPEKVIEEIAWRIR